VNHIIHLTQLRNVEHTVFCVQEGQKKRYDPVWQRYVAFSSGQQVKKCIVDHAMEVLGIEDAPVTFHEKINGMGKLENAHIQTLNDPSYPDLLIRGWMDAGATGGAIKRKSALNISPMTPLHPLLARVDIENLTFDRSQKPENHKVLVISPDGEHMSKEEVTSFLDDNQRTLPVRHWVPNNPRTSGLYIQKLCLDLSRLFAVRINSNEPEVDVEVKEKLIKNGWKKGRNQFGDVLVAPKEMRQEIIPALSAAMLNWKITSNQSTTYSPMLPVAFAIGSDAMKTNMAIRSRLVEKDQAEPVIQAVEGVDLFLTPFVEEVIAGETGDPEGRDKAERRLIELMSSYKYD
jgi:hypothetical protein